MIGRRALLGGAGVLGLPYAASTVAPAYAGSASAHADFTSAPAGGGELHHVRGIAGKYPADIGIENDPAVVFVEDFETDDVQVVIDRWTDHKRPDNMSIVTDVPPGATGRAMRLGPGADLYRRLPHNHERLFLRYYVKYETPSEYHHSGATIGGYNPPLDFPFPHAGERPAGDDRVLIGIEPLSGRVATPDSTLRFDFYNYWMHMRTNPGGTYFGNDLINDPAVVVPAGTWTCVEVMVKLNHPVHSFNGELALWLNGRLVTHLRQSRPRGYWVWDSFHPDPYADPFEGFQFRSTGDLGLNWIWLQNFITSDLEAAVFFDHVVMAKKYVGPLRVPVQPVP
jgi:hypothetical protein